MNFILGGPACGKGTFCKKLVEINKDVLTHISAGELLRKEIKNNDTVGISYNDKTPKIATFNTLRYIV